MTPFDELYPEAPQAEPQPEPEPEDTLDEFLMGLDPEDVPTDFVRIVSGGGARDIPLDPEHQTDGLPGYTLREIMEMGYLAYNAATQFWSGETQINLDTVLASGAVVTVVGVVKGG